MGYLSLLNNCANEMNAWALNPKTPSPEKRSPDRFVTTQWSVVPSCADAEAVGYSPTSEFYICVYQRKL